MSSTYDKLKALHNNKGTAVNTPAVPSSNDTYSKLLSIAKPGVVAEMQKPQSQGFSFKNPLQPANSGALSAQGFRSAEKQNMEQNATQVKTAQDKLTPKKHWYDFTDPIVKGLAGFNTSVATTAFKSPISILSGPVKAVSDITGIDIAGRLLEPLNSTEQGIGTRVQEQKDNSGKGFNTYSTIAEGVGSALPNAALAIMSGGASAVEQLPALANNVGLSASVKAGLSAMGKNPAFMPSLLQSTGASYNEAIANGATEDKAALSSMLSGIIQSGIEVTGGIETLPADIRKGGASAIREWVTTMLDEGKEEVVQNVIDKLTAKVVYDPNKPLVSLNNPNAVFNPAQSAKDFATAAAVGGLLGGGQIAANNILNGKPLPKAQTAQPTTQTNNAPLPVMSSALAQSTNTQKPTGFASVLDKPTQAIESPKTVSEASNTTALPEGMGAASNPYKTSQKVSEFYTNTIKNTDLLDDVAKSQFEPRDYTFDSVSEKKSVANAIESLQHDFYGEVEDIGKKEAFTAAEDVDKAMGILGSYARAASGSGDYEQMTSWAKDTYQKAHSAAVSLQALDKYSRTPEGAVIKAVESIEGAVDKMTTTKENGKTVKNNLGKKIETETKQVSDAVQDEGKKAAQDVIDEVLGTKNGGQSNNKTNSVKERDHGLPVKDWATETGKLISDNISKRLEPSNPKPKPITTIILNDLVKFAEEHALPNRMKSKVLHRTATARIADYFNNREFYAKAWNEAKKQIREKYADNQEALDAFDEWLNSTILFNADSMASDKTMLDAVMESALATDNKVKAILDKASLGDVDGVIKAIYEHLKSSINPSESDAIVLKDAVTRYVNDKIKGFDTDKRLTSMVTTALKDIKVKLSEIITKGKTDKASVSKQISDLLVNKYGISKESAEKVANNITNRFYDLVKEKSQARLKSMFKEQSLSAKKADWFKKLDELVNLGAFDTQSYADAIKKKYGLPTLDATDIKKIYEYMEKSYSATDDYVRREWLDRAVTVVSDKLTSSTWDKIRTVRQLSMLLNPKTLISKNAGGNLVSSLVENIKDVPAALIDTAVSLKTGQRAKPFAPISNAKAQLGGFKRGFVELGKDIKNGVNTSPTSHEMNNPSMKDLRPTTSFKGANPVSKVIKGGEKALNILLQAGDRPFYEAAYDQRMNELKKLGYDTASEENIADATQYGLERVFQNNGVLAKKAMQMRDSLGPLGDIIMPYVQTPTNIFDRLLDYTPVGLAKAVYKWGSMTGSVFSQRQFVDTLARSLTGTGIMTLGYVLAKAGLITGRLPDDNKKAQAEKLSGKQAYSIVVGDKSYTYDWASPIGSLLAIGSDMYQAGTDKQGVINVLKSAGEAGLDVMFQQSYLEGLSQLFSYNSISKGLEQTIMSLPASFVPTGFSQIAKVLDKTQRETYDQSALKQVANKILVKLPGFSTTLQPKVSTSGDNLQNFNGRPTGSNVFESFLSPGYIGQNTMTAVDREMTKLYSSTGESSVLPPSAPDKMFSVNTKDYTMTSAEYAKFQQVRNKSIYTQVNNLMQTNDYKKADDADKTKMVKDIVSSASDLAKQTIVEGRGYMYLDASGAKKVQQYVDISGITQKQSYEIYKAVSSLTPEQGKTSVSDYQKISTIMSQNISSQQKTAIISTIYTTHDKDGNVNEQSLLPYLNNADRLLSLYSNSKTDQSPNGDSALISMNVPKEFSFTPANAKVSTTYELTDAEKELFKQTYVKYFNNYITGLSTANQVKKIRDNAYNAAKIAVIKSR